MKLLLDGKLSESMTMKDVLEKIFRLQSLGLSLLRMSIIDGQLVGNIRINNGREIIGVSLKGSVLSEQELLVKLLATTDAAFNYMSLDWQDQLETENTLKIDIMRLLENWQNLGRTQSFEQGSLLDSVFGDDSGSFNARGNITGQFSAVHQLPVSGTQAPSKGKTRKGQPLMSEPPIKIQLASMTRPMQKARLNGQNGTGNDFNEDERRESEQSRREQSGNERWLRGERQQQLRRIMIYLCGAFACLAICLWFCWIVVKVRSGPEKNGDLPAINSGVDSRPSPLYMQSNHGSRPKTEQSGLMPVKAKSSPPFKIMPRPVAKKPISSRPIKDRALIDKQRKHLRGHRDLGQRDMKKRGLEPAHSPPDYLHIRW